MNNSKTIKTINPATEEIIQEYEVMTKEQVNNKVNKAQNTFQEDWKNDANKRTDLLHDFANQLRKEKENPAMTATKEMGKAGGVKKSGFGRELSRYGMLEFVNIKSVRFYDQLIHNHYVE